MIKPLEGILVLDFSQFLSGPSASLRLADLGAEVIKIEKPVVGDICRSLYVSDVKVAGESTIFHSINRNKKSYLADLKEEYDLAKIKQLVQQADIFMHNFRPGVMERLGLSYDEVIKINPSIIYAELSGYGKNGSWKGRPGQDLLLQAVSGVTYLTGNQNDAPTAMGVAAADILAGTQLAQGILAALFQKGTNGKGAKIQISMLESLLDFQFEVLTCFYNDGNHLPQRSAVNSAHAYIAAPYGIYQTTNGFIALAMGNILQLGELLNCKPLLEKTDPKEWFNERDSIKLILKGLLKSQTTQYWLNILEPADIWCAEVLNYERLVQHEGYKVLQMEQEVINSAGYKLRTTRCPIRIDNQLLSSDIGAPLLGEHTTEINNRFDLK